MHFILKNVPAKRDETFICEKNVPPKRDPSFAGMFFLHLSTPLIIPLGMQLTEFFLNYDSLFEALVILVVCRLFLLVLWKNEYLFL